MNVKKLRKFSQYKDKKKVDFIELQSTNDMIRIHDVSILYGMYKRYELKSGCIIMTHGIFVGTGSTDTKDPYQFYSIKLRIVILTLSLENRFCYQLGGIARPSPGPCC